MNVIYKAIEYDFVYYESENCWVAQKLVDISGYNNLNFELHVDDFVYKEINWSDIKEFIEFFNNIDLKALDLKGQKMLMSLIDVMGVFKPVEDYRLDLSAIYPKGKHDPAFASGHNCHVFTYSLAYSLYDIKHDMSVDDYALYFVDMEDNGFVTGCRRK